MRGKRNLSTTSVLLLLLVRVVFVCVLCEKKIGESNFFIRVLLCTTRSARCHTVVNIPQIPLDNVDDKENNRSSRITPYILDVKSQQLDNATKNSHNPKGEISDRNRNYVHNTHNFFLFYSKTNKNASNLDKNIKKKSKSSLFWSSCVPLGMCRSRSTAK